MVSPLPSLTGIAVKEVRFERNRIWGGEALRLLGSGSDTLNVTAYYVCGSLLLQLRLHLLAWAPAAASAAWLFALFPRSAQQQCQGDDHHQKRERGLPVGGHDWSLVYVGEWGNRVG